MEASMVVHDSILSPPTPRCTRREKTHRRRPGDTHLHPLEQLSGRALLDAIGASIRSEVDAWVLRELLCTGQPSIRAEGILDQVHALLPARTFTACGRSALGDLLRRSVVRAHSNQAVRTVRVLFVLRSNARRPHW